MAGYGYLKWQYPPSYDKLRYQENYDDFSPQQMYEAWQSSGQPVPVDPQSVYDQAAPLQAPQAPAAAPIQNPFNAVTQRQQYMDFISSSPEDQMQMIQQFQPAQGLMGF